MLFITTTGRVRNEKVAQTMTTFDEMHLHLAISPDSTLLLDTENGKCVTVGYLKDLCASEQLANPLRRITVLLFTGIYKFIR